MASLKPQLKSILKAAEPTQKLLQMPLIEENDQLELAKYFFGNYPNSPLDAFKALEKQIDQYGESYQTEAMKLKAYEVSKQKLKTAILRLNILF